MIKIVMRNKKFRILLGDEVWEFNEDNDFQEVLITLARFKRRYGENVKND